MNEYNICLLGPTSCGKTTLLASAANEFMKFSEEISHKDKDFIKIVPRGMSKNRINSSIDAIKTSTRLGEFLTPALESTQDHTMYDFDIAYINKSEEIKNPDFRLRFHDFPGGWIASDDPRLEKIKFKDAQILVMPVDASLIYEAVRPQHQTWAAMQLEIQSLLEVAKRWANGRKEDVKHPGLFILAPVKCETYHNDNLPIGLRQDNSTRLRDKVLSHFKEIVSEIQRISPATKAWYMPVDTIGCCFLNDKNWEEGGPKGMEFVAQYQIPGGYEWTPFGPANLMLKIVEYLIESHESNKGIWDKFLDLIGWNPDMVKRLRKMQTASDKKYKRSIQLWKPNA